MNPIYFLLRSMSKFFHFDEVNQVFHLDSSLEPYAGRTLASHITDILRYRATDYFAKRYRNTEPKRTGGEDESQ